MSTGVFGGTFDPVHIGHLRTALELKDYLGLDRMLLIPCGDPPHRDKPMTAARDRLAMLELAVGPEPDLVADSREIRRPGPSYSIDTLTELRAELGDTEPLCFCIGLDSLLSFNSWDRWRQFLDIAHLVVAVRPGWEMPQGGEIADWVAAHHAAGPEELANSPAGRILIEEMTLLPVSATRLRRSLAKGESVRYLTPDSVIDYIRKRRLYV